MSRCRSNWSRLVTFVPEEVATPWTVPALADAVGAAVDRKRCVKAIGSAHSFTDIADTDGLQLDLSNYTGLVELSLQRQQATLRSGTRLWQIPSLLADTGLALENLGDIHQQSIAGAISTGTHGTGLAFGGLGSQVVGLDLLTGRGEPLHVSADANPELLDLLRVGLGAFGIITAVTLQLVPEYDLHTVEAPASLDAILHHWDELNSRHDHFEFFWFGHDDTAMTKTSNRIAPTRSTLSLVQRAKRQLADEVVTNLGLGTVCQLGRAKPSLIPTLNRISTKVWGSTERTAHWSTAFASMRRVRFNEMEYALPYDDIPEILTELRRLFRRADISSTFPLEIRTAAPETAWLAPNHARKTGYIAVHQHIGQDHRAYFDRIEPIFKAAGGRPHWGKLHTLGAADMADRYPNWSAMVALRDQLDPDRNFTNDYLKHVLGH